MSIPETWTEEHSALLLALLAIASGWWGEAEDPSDLEYLRLLL